MFLKNKYTMNYKIIDIPKINNAKGNIGVVENDTIPFDVKRVYYLFDVPSGAKRGGHAHKKLKQVILAISGSFDVVLKDGKSKEIIKLNRPDKGLLIENNIWRELENTMGSKSNHAQMQKLVVQMKDELEKIKEQVLNVCHSELVSESNCFHKLSQLGLDSSIKFIFHSLCQFFNCFSLVIASLTY